MVYYACRPIHLCVNDIEFGGHVHEVLGIVNVVLNYLFWLKCLQFRCL
jgi:hypothetical protein